MKKGKDKPTRKGQHDPEQVAADHEGHRKLLAKVPPEVQKQRLAAFRLDQEVMAAPWIVCPPEALRPNARLVRRYIHPLVPRSLDDLKHWLGVPSEVAARRLRGSSLNPCGGCWGPMAEVPTVHLPMSGNIDFAKLDGPRRAAVHQAAQNLLFGEVDPEEVKRPPLAGIVGYLMERARDLAALVIPDLIICPGQRVELSGFPAALFNNILIYGNGELAVRGQMKIHAFQIRRV